MEYLWEAFEPAFMQRALVGGLIASLATSVIGTWVVLRGLAFLGDALSHGVVPGVALAVLWGVNPMIGAFVAALIMSGLVSLVSNRTVVREETAIGLLFVGMLSLGIVIVSRSSAFATEVTGLLFGDVLGITADDIRNQLIAAAVVLIVGVGLYRPFLALTFNREKAVTLGMHPSLAHPALLALLALSIVASFQAVGTLLVFGLLVGPPATASLFVHRVAYIMLISMVLSATAVIAGLIVSFHHGTAGGATIAGICVLQFFVALMLRESIEVFGRRRVGNGVSVGT